MPRWFPPLLVLVLLAGVVAWRLAADPERIEARSRIRALAADPTTYGEALEAIDAHLAAYDHPEEAWFAAEMLLHLRRFDRTIAILFPGTGPVDADRARRFSETALVVLRYEDMAGTHPSGAHHAATIALMEGGHQPTIDTALAMARERHFSWTMNYLFHAVLFGTPDVVARLRAAYRHNEHEDARVFAAMSALDAEPYPEREADLELVMERVRAEPEATSLYADAVHALGRTELPAAVAFLRERLEARRAEGTVAARRRVPLLRAGLLASGDWSQQTALTEAARREPFVAAWYREALLHRLERGDAAAPDAVRTLWNAPKANDDRRRIAHAVLLKGPPGRETDLAARVHADLLASPAAVERALGLAASLRRGEPGGRRRLLDLLVTESGRLDRDQGLLREVIESTTTALRALYLY